MRRNSTDVFRDSVEEKLRTDKSLFTKLVFSPFGTHPVYVENTEKSSAFWLRGLQSNALSAVAIEKTLDNAADLGREFNISLPKFHVTQFGNRFTIATEHIPGIVLEDAYRTGFDFTKTISRAVDFGNLLLNPIKGLPYYEPEMIALSPVPALLDADKSRNYILPFCEQEKAIPEIVLHDIGLIRVFGKLKKSQN